MPTDSKLAMTVAKLANADNVVTKIATLPDDDLSGIFSFGAPRAYSNGKGMSATVSVAGGALKFQSPQVYTPFGTDTREGDSGMTKIALLCTLRPMAKNAEKFEKLLQGLEKATVYFAFENRDALGFAGKSREVLEEAYFHPVLQKREPYDPQFKCRVMESDVRVFERKEGAIERVDGYQVPPKSNVVVSVRFGPVWCVQGRFGVHVNLEQAVILSAAGENGGEAAAKVPDRLVLELDEEEEDTGDDADAPAAKKTRRIAEDEDDE